MNTPLNQMNQHDAGVRLMQIVQEAYHRRSRQLPANLADIVATLKADVLKYMPSVGIETIDEAITFETLHDDKTPLSPAFLFAAIRKHYTPPTPPRDMDKGELYYWNGLLQDMERLGLGNHPKAQEARKMINFYTYGEHEGDTISLLDTLAANLAAGRPCWFNAKREYSYLVMRRQLDLCAADNFINKAKLEINDERTDEGRKRIDWNIVGLTDDLTAMAKRLAVIDWLRACNTRGTMPSDILTPLVNENQYKDFRSAV